MAKFAERFGIDENEISKLLGQSYQRKLKNRGTPVSEFVKFKFKTLPEDEETSNQDIAGFIKDILDRKVNDDILTCRNVAEYKAFMRFLTLLPELRDDVLNSHQTYLSTHHRYPADKNQIQLRKLPHHLIDAFRSTLEEARYADAITHDMHRGVTVLDGKGWYTKQDTKVLMVITRKSDLNLMLRYIKQMDSNAFLSVSSVNGVYGKGFDSIKK